MLISRADLFHLMGVSNPPFPTALSLESADGARRAVFRWEGDEFSAEISETIPGESGVTILTIEGTYDEPSKTFDLEAQDFRDEASDPRDLQAVAHAFKFLTGGMSPVV